MLFSEAAPETSKKVGRDDVAKAADNLVKQAVKVGIFWANSSPPKAAEASACTALKKLPGSNDAAVGRALVTVAASMKDVARELGEMVEREGEERGEGDEKGEGDKTGEREEEGKANGNLGRKQQETEDEGNDKEKDDGDEEEEEEEEEESLGEEERVLARSGLCVCGAAEGVVRCLIYLVAAWPQHRDSWGQQQLAQTPQQLQQEQEEEREQREQQPKSADNGNASSSSDTICINDDESTHMASFLETFAVAD
ncbi:hypothetical protein CLOM_g11707 [Closterium sp. NIES-68]|nr:hypothetical protein CLOM_g11707 [Closterium sp. NIES-68]